MTTNKPNDQTPANLVGVYAFTPPFHTYALDSAKDCLP